MSDSGFVRVAQVGEIKPGDRKLIDIDGRPIALFNVDGKFYAIDDICTHDGGPLADGPLKDYEVECPRHGARFDVRSGTALCMPAFESVTVHDVKLEGEDVFVRPGDLA
jgi:3-phenylpropionate/trans-cinnamate dioxygenase ferredoxin subunit